MDCPEAPAGFRAERVLSSAGHCQGIEVARRRFSDHFDCPVTTNMYMNAEGAAGFVEHHDPHDVFAIQLAGRYTAVIRGYSCNIDSLNSQLA